MKKRAKNKLEPALRASTKQEWNALLKDLGLPVLGPWHVPRRANPLLDEDENGIEQMAVLSLDGTPLVGPEKTEIHLAVTPGAFIALANHLGLSGVERTVLGMRLLTDSNREETRAYFLHDHPKQASEAMNAWRKFSEHMPEIRAFLEGYRQDCEMPAKPKYRIFE